MSNKELACVAWRLEKTSGEERAFRSQPHPQGLLLDDFQNGGSSGEDPGQR